MFGLFTTKKRNIKNKILHDASQKCLNEKLLSKHQKEEEAIL
jgi:hypothetical protein